MEFSLFYFADDSTAPGANLKYDLLLSGARFADENDFAAVWTPERHFHPFGGLYPNSAVTGAAVAAVTKRVGVRAGSVNAPLHNPIRIAEEWSVVDNISAGRAGVSFASGWHPDDFTLSSETYSDRKRVTLETIQTVRKLWAGESIPITNGVGEQKNVRIYPTPIQHDIPIWITCAGSIDSFRTAGQTGAGVLTHLLGQDIEELSEKINEYRRASIEATGRPGHVALMLHTLIGENNEAVRDLVRQPLSQYLRSSFGLIAQAVQDPKAVDPEEIDDADVEYLVSKAVDRYFETGGLFGTVDKASHIVERLQKIGVDEIACLIDFGVEPKIVQDGFQHLDRLRARFQA